jgi:hypothetical protein
MPTNPSDIVPNQYAGSTSVIDNAVLGLAYGYATGGCCLWWCDLLEHLGSHQPGGFGSERLHAAVDRLVEIGYLHHVVDDDDDSGGPWRLLVPLPATGPVEEVQ